jgi:hypothetical protein
MPSNLIELGMLLAATTLWTMLVDTTSVDSMLAEATFVKTMIKAISI